MLLRPRRTQLRVSAHVRRLWSATGRIHFILTGGPSCQAELGSLMKFALAAHGTRGDIEPCAAVGVELLRRGHDVRMAAPQPDWLRRVGRASRGCLWAGLTRTTGGGILSQLWKIQNPIGVLRKGEEYLSQGWAEMSTTLTSLAEGADLVLSGQTYQGLAANVAEYYDIPFAALHYMPQQVNGHVVPFLPPPLIRSAIAAIWWLHWRMTRGLKTPNAVNSACQRLQPIPRGGSRIADLSRSRPTTRSTSPGLRRNGPASGLLSAH